MKKYIYIALAAAAFASCSQDETMSLNQEAIEFGNAFVDNATRALNDDYSGTKTLTGFKVYGTVTGNANTVNLFKDVAIARPLTNGAYTDADWGKAWDYVNQADKQYWVPGCTYNFAAIVDGTVDQANGVDENGMPKTIGYTLGDGDLLYAISTASTVDNTPSIVGFTFKHLLSKFYFTITDNFSTGAEGYQYVVSDIKVSGIPSSGTYTVGTTVEDGTWVGGSNTVPANSPLNFGVATEDHLIIPVKQTLNISFSYDVMFKGEKISTIPVSESLTHTFAQSTVYNITAILPALGNEIQFTVTAKPGAFTTGTGVDIQ